MNITEGKTIDIRKEIIEKACRWLQEKDRMGVFEMILGRNYIEDFKKAMEE